MARTPGTADAFPTTTLESPPRPPSAVANAPAPATAETAKRRPPAPPLYAWESRAAPGAPRVDRIETHAGVFAATDVPGLYAAHEALLDLWIRQTDRTLQRRHWAYDPLSAPRVAWRWVGVWLLLYRVAAFVTCGCSLCHLRLQVGGRVAAAPAHLPARARSMGARPLL